MDSVEVCILDVNLRHLDKTFTYETADTDPSPGSLVRVPFHGRLRNGVVVGPAEPFPGAARIKAVLGPGLPPWMIGLARALAAATLSDLGSALAAMVPGRVKTEEDKLVGLEDGAGLPSPEPAMPRTAPRVLRSPGFGDDVPGEIAEAVDAEVAAGGRVIVALADADRRSEVAARVLATMGDSVAWLGSDVSDRLRYRAWLRSRFGIAPVAMGGRAAIFAPIIPSLVIVVDEGNPVHKEGRAPRFHTRTVAELIADTHCARLILVGTPPSIEARVDADPRRNRYTLQASPHQQRIDIRIVEPSGLIPSPNTMRLLDPGQGRILVLVHRNEHVEAARERVSRHLDIEAGCVDARTSAEDLAHARSGQGAPALIASPVLAADHRIRDVHTLVISDADAALASPGSRAAEELVGSWWRLLHAATPRRVLLESKDRDHHAIQAIVKLDHDIFARREADARNELGYPPYRSMVRFQIDGANMDRVMKDLEGNSIIGPMKDPIDEAMHVIAVRGDRGLVARLQPMVAAWRVDGVRFRADVDPWDLVEERWRS